MGNIDAMVPLASVLLTSNQTTVNFTGIVGTFKDLRIVANYGVTADADVAMQVNGDTGANYVAINMRGNGSTAISAVNTPSFVQFGLQNVTVPTTLTTCSTIDWVDYSATDKQKLCLIRVSDGSAMTMAKAGRWGSTSAITSISLYGVSASFLAGSTFNLFGIRG